jgi:hypothetical protein
MDSSDHVGWKKQKQDLTISESNNIDMGDINP